MYEPSLPPWFDAKPIPSSFHRIAIVGGGIAGAVSGWVLAQAGFAVDLFDAHQPGTQGSGNVSGIVMPVLTRDHNLRSQFFVPAIHSAEQWLMPLLTAQPQLGQWCGSYWLGHHAQLSQRLAVTAQGYQGFFMPDTPLCTWHDQVKGFDYPALWMTGGWVAPCALVHYLLAWLNGQPQCHVYSNHEVTTLTITPSHQTEVCAQSWSKNDTITATYDATVLCTGALTGLVQCCQPNIHKGLQSAIGVVNHLSLPNTYKSPLPDSVPVSHKGYICPTADKNRLLIGASYQRLSQPLLTPGESLEGVVDDHAVSVAMANNWQSFHRISQTHWDEQICTESHHQGKRLATDNRLPCVGWISDESTLVSCYAGVAQNPNRPFSSHAALPVLANFGHGSRGLTSSFLAAEMVRDLLSNQSSQRIAALPHGVWAQIHPNRHVIRQMIRHQYPFS